MVNPTIQLQSWFVGFSAKSKNPTFDFKSWKSKNPRIQQLKIQESKKSWFFAEIQQSNFHVGFLVNPRIQLSCWFVGFRRKSNNPTSMLVCWLIQESNFLKKKVGLLEIQESKIQSWFFWFVGNPRNQPALFI